MPAATLHPTTPEVWGTRRVVVVVAHPDDEVLGCGVLLSTLDNVRVVHVTDGAPRDGADALRKGFASPADYAAMRRDEALAGLALAGVSPAQVTGFGIPDQAAAAWLTSLTRTLVPFVEGCDLVLTHCFEGGHPDHDAVAFAVTAAVRLCKVGACPELYEMPFYHGDEGGWVRQRFLPVSSPLASGAARSPRETEASNPIEIVHPLSPADQKLKRAMLAAHHTQAETLASFAVDAERFRGASQRDFTVRPHQGPLLYERHAWNLTWPEWQSHVRAANTSLDL